MAEMGKVIACETVGAWKQQLLKAKQSHKLIVVDFTAAWCGPCRAMAPFLAELAKKMTNVLFLKVDVDELPSVAKEWGVSAIPFFVIWRDGKIMDKFVGARKDVLQKTLLQHAA